MFWNPSETNLKKMRENLKKLRKNAKFCGKNADENADEKRPHNRGAFSI
jgi:hypothetical protein